MVMMGKMLNVLKLECRIMVVGFVYMMNESEREEVGRWIR